ncbi:MAG TPA: hypothetical protein VHB02_09545 [Acidimicrobiales bacterium]|nr:hypothetical protein [Acidimicrobiales bacterium]
MNETAGGNQLHSEGNNSGRTDAEVLAADLSRAGGQLVADDPFSFEWSGQEAEDADVRPQLSAVRVTIALVVAAAAVFFAVVGIERAVAPKVTVATPWFAPYVDATLSPVYQFQDPALNAASQVYLGFVVAKQGTTCTPSWGGNYSPADANADLDLDRRVNQVRLEGGEVFVSFGGAKNVELANSCRSSSLLASAYESIVRRYNLEGMDFDLEKANLTDQQAMERRAIAVAQVQRTIRAPGGGPLPVWLTVPSTPQGLDADGLDAIRIMLSHHVSLAGINLLTMDMGTDDGPAPNMLAWTKSALLAAHTQLGTAFAGVGDKLTPTQVWDHMGATVMIGQNDVSNEVFTLDDARGLVAFAGQVGIGRISMWSLNRDFQCAANFSHVRVLSNTCSGVTQSDLEFSNVLSKAKGQPPGAPAVKEFSAPTTTTTKPGSGSTGLPYPQWLSSNIYPAGYKVTWNGDVYQAKWSTQGQPPDSPVRYQYQNAWQLIGPVLPTDKAPTTTTLPSGTYPDWSPSAAYPQGSKVLYDGLPFVSKYYAVGAPPDPSAVNSPVSPWQPLFTVPGEPSQQ